MRRIFAVLTAFLLLLSLTACGDDGTGMGFRLPIGGEPRQLDPQSATEASSVTVITTLFEGLTRLDADGNVIDGAATYTVSNNGLTYTFTLKESYWSTLSIRGEQTDWDEPTRVIAADFVFGWQRAVSPDNQSGTATALYGIKNAEAIHKGEKKLSDLGVKAVSDTVLTVTLEKADPSFPARLATAPFMPCDREFFEYTAGRYGLETNHLISNGAFSLTAWNHGQSLLLNKNEHYHAADAVAPSAVRFVIDTKDDTVALTDGDLDAAFLPADKVDEAREAGISVHSLEDTVRGVYFNTAVPALGNASVRRALRDAIEWTTVYAHLAAAGEPKATGYIPPDARVGNEPYRNGENAATWTTHVESAQNALGAGLAAVYPEEEHPAMPRLTFLAAEDTVSADAARYIIQSWQKNLKLSCTLELVDEQTLSARLRSGNYQIALYSAVGGGLTAADNLTAFVSGAGNNLTGFADPSFDTAYAEATSGGRARVTAAEAMLRDACPVIPVSFPHRAYGVAANCEGVTVRPFGGGTYSGEYEFLQAKKFDD